jgi:hypothetical protein
VLYGEPKPWGCEWFEKWKILVMEAVEKGQMIIVFYKAGHLARVGAEHTSFPRLQQVEGEVEWVDLSSSSFEQLKAMPGLGASQKGEVAYLKKIGASFMRVDVGEGAPRQIASGLRLVYSEEQMLGQRLIVVCNLKARKLMGFPSHGMVVPTHAIRQLTVTRHMNVSLIVCVILGQF